MFKLELAYKDFYVPFGIGQQRVSTKYRITMSHDKLMANGAATRYNLVRREIESCLPTRPYLVAF